MSVDPIHVRIILFPERTAEPVHQHVPWQFQGTLEFTVDDAEFDLQRGGITFDHPVPYVRTVLEHHRCVFAVNNDNPAETGIPWHYTAWLIEGGIVRFVDDPTVENDSPPPPLP